MSEDTMKISCEFTIPYSDKIKTVVLETCGFAQLMVAVMKHVGKKEFASQKEESRLKSNALAAKIVKAMDEEKCSILESAIAIQAVAVGLAESAESTDGGKLIQMRETTPVIVDEREEQSYV